MTLVTRCGGEHALGDYAQIWIRIVGREQFDSITNPNCLEAGVARRSVDELNENKGNDQAAG